MFALLLHVFVGKHSNKIVDTVMLLKDVPCATYLLELFKFYVED